MLILAIETSCDETAVALVEANEGKFRVIDELISSQIKVHSPFGGVVPNLAAREHLKNLPILLRRIISKNQISQKNLDLICFTQGPGLIPALLIGTNSAKALAYAWNKPLVGVNHIEGHIYANFVRENPKSQIPNPKRKEIKFPILALVVSGGHTELIFMKNHLNYRVVGQTLDDAAGEAFDKVAKILKLGYPGGPKVAALAAKIPRSKFQIPNKSQMQNSDSKRNSQFSILNSQFILPRPMLNSNDLNFSFSGLKTAVLYTVRDNPKILKNDKLKRVLCAEFQQAVIDVLISKTVRAAIRHKPKTILLGGGVSANKELREQLREMIKREIPNTKYHIPNTKYSLDNAAMIAAAGYFRYKFGKNTGPLLKNWKHLEAKADLKLKSIKKI